MILLLAVALWPAAGFAAAASSAITGIVVEPDGTGARIAVALDGPFHYLIDRRGDHVVILLDPVSAAAADHTLTIGLVRSLRVRSLAGAPPRAEITIFTAEPVEVADSLLEARTLAVRLVAARGRVTTAAAPRSSSVPVQVPRPAAVPAPDATAPARDATQPERIAGRTVVARAVTLDEGTGRLLDVDHLARVAVSDPRVVGVVPVSGRELLVTARAAGQATVYVWEGRDRLVAYAIEVRGGEDPFRDLRHALAALLPDSAITVTEVHGVRATIPTPQPAGSAPAGMPAALPPAPQFGAAPRSGPPPEGRGVVLSGTVETQNDRAKAEEVARAFVSAVVNLLTIRRPVQFSLRVEVVEINRSAQEALGIAWGGGQQTPGSTPSLNGGVYNLQILTAPGLAANGLDLLIAQLEALSQRGQARLLARPGLVVLAGRTASLLLGGQVPVPVAGANGTVTIEYKDFGVLLTAKPEYQDDGRVFLQITPEVSTLDFTDAIKVSGFAIPALRVRRAQTMVAMRPGETLVLGGLLQRDDVESVQKVPLLADLPIIGALFRSRSFQRQESDLLILVTPQLVESPHTP
ncbi:MAG TPA: pilus assembly protein N-terminal domain-containing protein [bacterium]|nr:pilus assembly protein N-terminal domain-containing protein [bacterium]